MEDTTMRSERSNPLRRNQHRIDAIGHLLSDNKLLDEDAIDDLAHDLGDLEDAAITFVEHLDSLRSSLERLRESPKDCFDKFNSLGGWFEEFRMHMRSAEPIIERICDEIIRRNPREFPWAAEEQASENEES